MYKKFLNAILFGALILGSAGTITSCKDYDDEIDEINQKLNTLSSKDELAAQVSSLTSTISAAQAAAAQASTEAANALANAKEAAAQAEAAAANAGVATGQSAEAINGAKAAATTADNAAAAAKEAAATAAKASADAAKAVAAGEDATKALADAKKAADAAAATAKEAAEAAAAAKKAGEEAAAAAGTAAAKAVADAQVAIADAAKKVAEESAKEAAAAAVALELKAINERLEKLEKGGSVDPKALEEIQKAIEEAKKATNDLVGKISVAVTDVSLVDSYTSAKIVSSLYAAQLGQGTYANFFWDSHYFDWDGYISEEAIGENPLDLEFTTVFEAANITVAQGWGLWKTEFNTDPKKETGNFTGLGKDLKDAITFVKDRQVNRPAYFAVRVSPTNAVLTEDMIQLVNSNGENLDDIMEVQGVMKYEGDYLTRPDGYEPVYTRADGQETGLWVVKVALKEYDPETFDAATKILTDIPDNEQYQVSKVTTRASINQEDDNPASGQFGVEWMLVNKILYAVQVNNTAEDAADRYVTSSYDLSFDWAKYQPANRLHYSVNGKKVEDLNNRFDETSQSFFTDNNAALIPLLYGERAWLPNFADVKPNINLGNVPATKKLQNADITENIDIDNSYPTYGYANQDNRSGKQMLNVVPGETFTVTLDEFQGWAYSSRQQGTGIDKVPTKSAVRAMYIVLDQPTAIESEPSEWQAWQTYEYTGINQVVEGTSIDLTVDGEGLLSENGDIIGFRVYGINWDGTLVDPDGRAFYVQVGGGKASAGAATEKTPIDEKVTPSDKVGFELSTAAMTANHFVWQADVIPYLDSTDQSVYEAQDAIAFYPVFYNKADKTVIQSFDATVGYDDDGNLIIEGDLDADADALATVDQLYTVPMINNWLAYIDNKEYKGTLTLQYKTDKITRDVASIDITFTKKLPTKVPGAFSPKENQIVDGVYIAYLTPSTEDGADKWAVPADQKQETLEAIFGTRRMLDFLNLGTSTKDVESLAANYQFTFDEALIDADDNGDPILVENFIEKGNADPKLVVPAYFYDKDNKKSEVIDGKTKHHTTVEYNFGKISTALYWEKPNGTSGYYDYTVTAAEFETIFSDIYDNRIHTWDWVSLDQLKAEVLRTDKDGNYVVTIKDSEWADKVKADKAAGKVTVKDLPEDYIKSVIYGEAEFELNVDYFFGTNSYDGQFNGLLSNPYESSLEVKSATLSTTRTGMEEYYKFDSYADGKLKFVFKSNSTNPTADVPSTLTITVWDSYAHTTHKVVINGFNVKKR